MNLYGIYIYIYNIRVPRSILFERYHKSSAMASPASAFGTAEASWLSWSSLLVQPRRVSNPAVETMVWYWIYPFEAPHLATMIPFWAIVRSFGSLERQLFAQKTFSESRDMKDLLSSFVLSQVQIHRLIG